STGVIASKYTLIYAMQELEKKGYCIDCLKGVPDVAEMISYHDEAQLAVKKGVVNYKTFKTEEEAKNFIQNWGGQQLSAITNGKSWYIALPNDISIALTNAVNKATRELKLNVELGIEWIVNKNWYGCH